MQKSGGKGRPGRLKEQRGEGKHVSVMMQANLLDWRKATGFKINSTLRTQLLRLYTA